MSGRWVLGATGANERIRLGFIGVGNRGDQLLDAFLAHPEVLVTYLCDVYAPYIEAARHKVGGKAAVTRDYRQLLDSKDVDAVVISTPDHWHALQFIDACRAGKDVYVEKPLSLTVGEGRQMVRAARQYKRVTQVGINRRSSPGYSQAVKAIHQGAIGSITSCHCYHLSNECPMGIGRAPDRPPPPGLDWDLWLGPAPAVPYNENRGLYKFRWFRDYSGGQITNFGTHWLDVVQWCLRQDAPSGILAVAGPRVVNDGREIPDTVQVTWTYPNGVFATLLQSNANAAAANAAKAPVEIRGNKGTAYFLADGNVHLVPESHRVSPIPAFSPLNRGTAEEQYFASRSIGKGRRFSGCTGITEHTADFLKCMRTREGCRCDVEIGHYSTSATLLANISLDRNRFIEWDAVRERVSNDPDANKLLMRDYRPPWRLPE